MRSATRSDTRSVARRMKSATRNETRSVARRVRSAMRSETRNVKTSNATMMSAMSATSAKNRRLWPSLLRET